MEKNKLFVKDVFEKLFLLSVIVFIITNAFIHNDSFYAVVSAICGITYTFLAGKGLPICYIFGVTGSGFYSFLAFQNALWGNLVLYAGYYLPMQIIGYFKWNNNLKTNKQEIIKIKLPKKELYLLLIILFILSFIIFFILEKANDPHPLLDSITTVFSIGGMYLTVRRALEQWLFWMVVNLLSLIMWLEVALSGIRVYSTVIMWFVYLCLAVYFYINWKKELKH